MEVETSENNENLNSKSTPIQSQNNRLDSQKSANSEELLQFFDFVQSYHAKNLIPRCTIFYSDLVTFFVDLLSETLSKIVRSDEKLSKLPEFKDPESAYSLIKSRIESFHHLKLSFVVDIVEETTLAEIFRNCHHFIYSKEVEMQLLIEAYLQSQPPVYRAVSIWFIRTFSKVHAKFGSCFEFVLQKTATDTPDDVKLKKQFIKEFNSLFNAILYSYDNDSYKQECQNFKDQFLKIMEEDEKIEIDQIIEFVRNFIFSNRKFFNDSVRNIKERKEIDKSGVGSVFTETILTVLDEISSADYEFFVKLANYTVESTKQQKNRDFSLKMQDLIARKFKYILKLTGQFYEKIISRGLNNIELKCLARSKDGAFEREDYHRKLNQMTIPDDLRLSNDFVFNMFNTNKISKDVSLPIQFSSLPQSKLQFLSVFHCLFATKMFTNGLVLGPKFIGFSYFEIIPEIANIFEKFAVENVNGEHFDTDQSFEKQVFSIFSQIHNTNPEWSSFPDLESFLKLLLAKISIHKSIFSDTASTNNPNTSVYNGANKVFEIDLENGSPFKNLIRTLLGLDVEPNSRPDRDPSPKRPRGLRIFSFKNLIDDKISTSGQLPQNDEQHVLKAFIIKEGDGVTFSCVKIDDLWYLIIENHVFPIRDLDYFLAKRDEIVLYFYEKA